MPEVAAGKSGNGRENGANMPELPEVETVRRGLTPHIEGKRILGAVLNRPALRVPLPAHFAARLAGTRIGTPGRRAKYLLLPLDSGETLVIHLGMSGRLLVLAPEGAERPGRFHHDSERLERHDHVILTLEGGARLVFNDPRRFGFMLLEKTDVLEAHPAFSGLGAEPLGNAFNGAFLAGKLSGKRISVKAALLDQRLVAGLGNIYACEALHRAGIFPGRAAGTLRGGEIGRLVPAIRDVLRDAIQAGGSTLRDYRQGDGSPGYFQHDFRVYGREGEPCPRQGCEGRIARIAQSGRSTFFCPACQK